MIKYFSFVGSYEGGIKIKNQWVHAVNLNYINKSKWKRHQGSLTPAMSRCLRESKKLDMASDLGQAVVKWNLL
jgi:hypothetical protein